MPYYNKCVKCGAHLDPGERCDCEEKKKPSCQTTNSVIHIYYNKTNEEIKEERICSK